MKLEKKKCKEKKSNINKKMYEAIKFVVTLKLMQHTTIIAVLY